MGVAKQLLYTQVLREKIGELIGPAKDLRDAAAALRDQEDIFFSDAFLVERPILQAIRATEPPVLLLDEIDRADEEFEAFLLEFLSGYQVSIPEIGTITAVNSPLVVLTSNRSRGLSEATKRRCLHLQLDYPDAEMELEIVRLKAPGVGEDLARDLVTQIQRIRELDLRKAPSLGETLDWAQALVVLGAPSLSRELIEETLSVVIEYGPCATPCRWSAPPLTSARSPSTCSRAPHSGLDYVAAGCGSSRTMTVSATGMISSTGRSAVSACLRIASGLDAW